MEAEVPIFANLRPQFRERRSSPAPPWVIPTRRHPYRRPSRARPKNLWRAPCYVPTGLAFRHEEFFALGFILRGVDNQCDAMDHEKIERRRLLQIENFHAQIDVVALF